MKNIKPTADRNVPTVEPNNDLSLKYLFEIENFS